MDGLIESFGSIKQRLVFISDGATWIRNWIEDAFPDAISILDYFHAIEHLHEFTDSWFKEKEAAKKWAEKQKELLLYSNVKQVIKNTDHNLAVSNALSEMYYFLKLQKAFQKKKPIH